MSAPTVRSAAVVELSTMRWWHIGKVGDLERELFGDEAWAPELFWSELANPNTYYLVAHRPGDPDESLIGYGGLACAGDDAYVQTIGVTTAAQGGGVGRQLMNALLDEALRRAATTCWLEVRADNVVAQKLYTSLGFTGRGLRRGYYQPSGADALVMALELAP